MSECLLQKLLDTALLLLTPSERRFQTLPLKKKDVFRPSIHPPPQAKKKKTLLRAQLMATNKATHFMVHTFCHSYLGE